MEDLARNLLTRDGTLGRLGNSLTGLIISTVGFNDLVRNEKTTSRNTFKLGKKERIGWGGGKSKRNKKNNKKSKTKRRR